MHALGRVLGVQRMALRRPVCMGRCMPLSHTHTRGMSAMLLWPSRHKAHLVAVAAVASRQRAAAAGTVATCVFCMYGGPSTCMPLHARQPPIPPTHPPRLVACLPAAAG